MKQNNIIVDVLLLYAMQHSVQHFTVILPASHQNGIERPLVVMRQNCSTGEGQVMWTSGIYSIWLFWEGYIISYINKCTAQKIHCLYMINIIKCDNKICIKQYTLRCACICI